MMACIIAIPAGAALESKFSGHLDTQRCLYRHRFGQQKAMTVESLEAAQKEFNKKFKDKSGHKWEGRFFRAPYEYLNTSIPETCCRASHHMTHDGFKA